MSGGLSIHCVDVASGRVATGLQVALHRLGPDGEPLGIALADGLIGANGLLAHPALMSEAITAGGYEVRFAVGAFYRGQGAALPSPAFLRKPCPTVSISPTPHSTTTCRSSSRPGASPCSAAGRDPTQDAAKTSVSTSRLA
jgi:5-hydroxyisourate hydrolase